MNLDKLTTEEQSILEILKTVIDPEVAVNVVDLGLIYEIHHNSAEKTIHVLCTLSSRGCPLGDVIMTNMEVVIANHFQGYDIKIELTWEPEWNPDMITEEGRIAIDS